jgi:cytochrome oxidase Cu insertion factor (SCO1/SenC/PrrC family)
VFFFVLLQEISMKVPKASTISVLILVGTVLASLIYLLGSLAVSAASGGKAAASAAAAASKQGPASVYDKPLPIDDFTLTDQTGAKFQFSSTKGKLVLMSFLFTHCGDVCPYSAIKMKQALEQMGDDAKNVVLVTIDTDPERDTIEVVGAYSKDLGLYSSWHFVTGGLKEMTKVYKDLGITVVKTNEEEVMETSKNAQDLGITLPQKDQTDSPLFGLTDQQVVSGGDVAKKYSGGYQIAHSAPFWIIDRKGNLRVSLDVSASPAQIVENLKAYLTKD